MVVVQFSTLSSIMHRVIIIFSAFSAALLFVAGCTHTVQFRTVDATTGQPLAGVIASWRQDSHDLVLGSYHYGPTNLPPSSAQGAITVGGIYPKKASRFIFSKSGYLTVYGIYGSDELTRANSLSQVDRDGEFILTGDLNLVLPTNGFIIIQMSPR
jgi:hypothetical protein